MSMIPHEPRHGERLSADWGRDVIRALRGIRVSAGQGLRETQTANGKLLSLVPPRSAGAPHRPPYPFGPRYPFGIKIDGGNVTIYPTIIYHAGEPITLPQITLTLTEQAEWVYLRVSKADNTAAYDSASGASVPPEDTPEYFYRKIHQFDADANGNVTWKTCGWTGGDLDTFEEFEIVGDADLYESVYRSIEVVEDAETGAKYAQAYQWRAAPSYTIPYSGTLPKVVLRVPLDGGGAEKRYGTIADLCKAILAQIGHGDGIDITAGAAFVELIAGNGIVIDDEGIGVDAGTGITVDAGGVQVTHPIPAGGLRYQVLQKTSDSDYAYGWDYVRLLAL